MRLLHSERQGSDRPRIAARAIARSAERLERDSRLAAQRAAGRGRRAGTPWWRE